MWHARLYYEHCGLIILHFLFEYRKDFQKIQLLINWRNSLLIRERYMHVLLPHSLVISVKYILQLLNFLYNCKGVRGGRLALW